MIMGDEKLSRGGDEKSRVGAWCCRKPVFRRRTVDEKS